MHLPVLAMGTGFYVLAMAFPLVLHQIAPLVYLVALAGIVLVLIGLHIRWTTDARTSYPRNGS